MLKRTDAGVERTGEVIETRHRLRVAAVPLLGLLATACDRASYVEGVTHWRSTDAVYGVEFVTPPWSVASDDGVLLELHVAAEIFGVSVGGSPPTHIFAIGPVDPSSDLASLLPDSVQLGTGSGTGIDLGDLGDVTGGDGTGGAASPLLDVDLGNPREVALAELDHLVTDQQAELSFELTKTAAAGAPWRYDVVIPPGLYVRGLYYDGGGRTIRASFASMFSPADGDLDAMAATIDVVGAK